MFGFSPGPDSSSVPCVETWCGLPLHLLTGTQLTVMIRTLVTCAEVEPVLVLGLVFVFGGVVAGATGVPPTFAARADCACDIATASSSARSAAVTYVERL
jgi:hypothetical protein